MSCHIFAVRLNVVSRFWGVPKDRACCIDFLELLNIWLEQHLPYGIGWKLPNLTFKKRFHTNGNDAVYAEDLSHYKITPLFLTYLFSLHLVGVFLIMVDSNLCIA